MDNNNLFSRRSQMVPEGRPYGAVQQPIPVATVHPEYSRAPTGQHSKWKPMFPLEYQQKDSTNEIVTTRHTKYSSAYFSQEQNRKRKYPLEYVQQRGNIDDLASTRDTEFSIASSQEPNWNQMYPLKYAQQRGNIDDMATTRDITFSKASSQEQNRKRIYPLEYAQQRGKIDDITITRDTEFPRASSQEINRQRIYPSEYAQQRGNIDDITITSDTELSRTSSQEKNWNRMYPLQYVQPRDNIYDIATTRNTEFSRAPSSQEQIWKPIYPLEYSQQRGNTNDMANTKGTEFSRTPSSQEPNGKPTYPLEYTERTEGRTDTAALQQPIATVHPEYSSAPPSQEPICKPMPSSQQDNIDEMTTTRETKAPSPVCRDHFEATWTLPPPRLKKQCNKTPKKTKIKKKRVLPSKAVVDSKPLTKKQRHKLRRKLKRQEAQNAIAEATRLANATEGNKAPNPSSSGKDQASLNEINRLAAIGRSQQLKKYSAKSFDVSKMKLNNLRPNTLDKPKPGEDLVLTIKITETGFLTKHQADQVQEILQEKLFALARENPESEGPVFHGKPTFLRGTLQLWCADDSSVAWLKTAIDGFSLPSGETLTVKRLIEDMTLRISSCVFIPGIYNISDVGRILRYQNPWADVDRWRLHNIREQTANGMFIMMGIPKDVVEILLQRERRLCFMLGAVYVRFKHSKGVFSNYPPGMKIK